MVEGDTLVDAVGGDAVVVDVADAVAVGEEVNTKKKKVPAAAGAAGAGHTAVVVVEVIVAHHHNPLSP